MQKDKRQDLNTLRKNITNNSLLTSPDLPANVNWNVFMQDNNSAYGW